MNITETVSTTIKPITRQCDICKMLGYSPPYRAEVDALTITGQWAYLCRSHRYTYQKKDSRGKYIKGLYTTLRNVGKPGRKPYSD